MNSRKDSVFLSLILLLSITLSHAVAAKEGGAFSCIFTCTSSQSKQEGEESGKCFSTHITIQLDVSAGTEELARNSCRDSNSPEYNQASFFCQDRIRRCEKPNPQSTIVISNRVISHPDED